MYLDQATLWNCQHWALGPWGPYYLDDPRRYSDSGFEYQRCLVCGGVVTVRMKP